MKNWLKTIFEAQPNTRLVVTETLNGSSLTIGKQDLSEEEIGSDILEDTLEDLEHLGKIRLLKMVKTDKVYVIL